MAELRLGNGTKTNRVFSLAGLRADKATNVRAAPVAPATKSPLAVKAGATPKPNGCSFSERAVIEIPILILIALLVIAVVWGALAL